MAAPYAKTEQALTTLTPRALARLDKYAGDREMSRAEAIRNFIFDGLARAELGEVTPRIDPDET